MKPLAIFAIVALALLGDATTVAQAPVLELSGAISYTAVYRFDYSKDGHRNPVRFFIEFKARPAVGTEGQPGYAAESGSIHYYVFDIEKNQRVEKWLEGFAMLNHDAVAADHPATNIVITGNTATFEAFRMKWTIVDGGPGFESDTVTVDDGFRKKPLKLYAGDLVIAPAKQDSRGEVDAELDGSAPSQGRCDGLLRLASASGGPWIPVECAHGR